MKLRQQPPPEPGTCTCKCINFMRVPGVKGLVGCKDKWASREELMVLASQIEDAVNANA